MLDLDLYIQFQQNVVSIIIIVNCSTFWYVEEIITFQIVLQVLQKCVMTKHEDYNIISIVAGNFKNYSLPGINQYHQYL